MDHPDARTDSRAGSRAEPGSAGSRFVPWLAAVLVAGCTMAAYLNSLDGEFLMDDHCEIVENPALDSPWPPWRAVFVGHELPSRPLPYLTFTIDHAVWGKRPFGYHVTNLAIHLTAALALFWFVRTTLSLPLLREACAAQADALAAIIAALWATHPLQTQAVTYIYQRLESLTGMLCLLSLAAFAGGVVRGWNARWLGVCVAASAAAMFSKENAVVLPLVIAAYDWLLCAGAAPRPGVRLRFYPALFATWLVLGIQMVIQSKLYHLTGAFEQTPLAYALTQPRVILHYLRLSFWPRRLCFDLHWPISTTWVEIVPAFIYVSVLVAVVLYGVARRRAWAWPGIAFLLALAPTSSILPLAAVAEEYRMYLPLAAVVAATVLGVHAAIRRWIPPGPRRTAVFRSGAGVAACAVVVLILLTQARNRVYATPGGVWMDVIEQRRFGSRPYWNLAITCDDHGGVDAAIAYADKVLEFNADHLVYEHLVSRRLRQGDNANAERYLRHAIATQGDRIAEGNRVAVAHVATLAMLLNAERRFEEAEALTAEHLDHVRAGMGEDHPWTIALMVIHAGGLLRAGDTQAAERLARDAYDANLRTTGATVGAAAECLARVLRAQGREDEAAEIERAGRPAE